MTRVTEVPPSPYTLSFHDTSAIISLLRKHEVATERHIFEQSQILLSADLESA